MGIEESYTNTINSTLNDVFVWAALSTPSGVNVGHYLASLASINPKQTAKVFIPLSNLQAGNYTALIYATLCTQLVLSTTTTLPVTVH